MSRLAIYESRARAVAPSAAPPHRAAGAFPTPRSFLFLNRQRRLNSFLLLLLTSVGKLFFAFNPILSAVAYVHFFIFSFPKDKQNITKVTTCSKLLERKRYYLIISPESYQKNCQVII